MPHYSLSSCDGSDAPMQFPSFLWLILQLQPTLPALPWALPAAAASRGLPSISGEHSCIPGNWGDTHSSDHVLLPARDSLQPHPDQVPPLRLYAHVWCGTRSTFSSCLPIAAPPLSPAEGDHRPVPPSHRCPLHWAPDPQSGGTVPLHIALSCNSAQPARGGHATPPLPH